MRAEVAPDANLAMTGPLSSLTTFAAWGHTIAHSAHAIQSSSSISVWPPDALIAFTGQYRMHL